jgi:hypothetical protein
MTETVTETLNTIEAYEPITVSAETLIQTIREVADDDPERVYKAPDHMGRAPGGVNCYYVHTSADGWQAGCLIGKALNRLGVPLEVLRANEGKSAGLVINRLINLTGSFAETQSANTFASVAQDCQDQGSPWREAVHTAELNAGLALL